MKNLNFDKCFKAALLALISIYLWLNCHNQELLNKKSGRYQAVLYDGLFIVWDTETGKIKSRSIGIPDEDTTIEKGEINH